MPTLDESTPGPSAVAENDPVLRALLQCADACNAEAALEGLVRRAHVVIDSIVGYYRRRNMLDAADGEDITSTVRVRLLQKLRLVANDGETIATYDGYVARLTYNAVNDVFRGRFPQRVLLKRRLREIARRDSRFALEATPQGEICRLIEHGKTAVVTPVAVRSLPGDFGDAMETLLRAAAGPLPVSDLLAAVSIGHKSRAGRSYAGRTSMPGDDAGNPLLRLERREDVEGLWTEIELLPVAQRIALLLNLRSEGSGSAIALLVLVGATTFDALAAALAMSPKELAELWSDLPLNDLTIAARLGITRQQVINLRKSARKRLGRRTGVRQNQ
jgi:hypothetical protein